MIFIEPWLRPLFPTRTCTGGAGITISQRHLHTMPRNTHDRERLPHCRTLTIPDASGMRATMTGKLGPCDLFNCSRGIHRSIAPNEMRFNATKTLPRMQSSLKHGQYYLSDLLGIRSSNRGPRAPHGSTVDAATIH